MKETYYLLKICSVIALLFVTAHSQNKSQVKISDIIESLKSIRNTVILLQNKYEDKSIKDKLSIASQHAEELQILLSRKSNESQPSVYLDSLLPYQNLLEKYTESSKTTFDDKLKSGLMQLIEELETKLAYVQKSKGQTLRPVTVIVQTKKNDTEVQGYEIWYVPKGWAGNQDHYQRFDPLSSPSNMELPPGNYFIWAKKSETTSEQLPISLGRDGRSKRTIDLLVF